MRSFGHSATSAGLSTLLLLFAALLAVIVLFSQRILIFFPTASTLVQSVLLIIAIGLPVSLLIVLTYQIARLLHQRVRRRPGARLKTRLMLFFSLVVLLAGVPTAVVSVNFISSGIDLWLQADVAEALDGGEATMVDYYRQAADGLRGVAEADSLELLVSASEGELDRLWNLLRPLNPSLSFIQVVGDDGSADVAGDPRGALAGPAPDRSGPQSREDRGQLIILRHAVRRADSTLILGSILPPTFADRAQSVAAARETVTQLEQFRGLFRAVTIGIYLFLAFPILLVCILVSFLLADELILPVAGLVEATRRVAEGDFSFRIVARSDDDLAALVRSFNRMIGELGSSRVKLLKAEKISAWRELAQRLAHEIRNPLTPIKLSAERLLRRWQENPQALDQILQPAVSAIVTEVENLNRMLVEFREFARLPDPQLAPLELRALVEETLQVYAPLLARIEVDVEGIPAELTLPADRNQLKRVFTNLIQNALHAMPEGGQLTLRADIVSKADVSYCRIQLRDTGTGIDPTAADQVFEPYVTTKRDGSGLGLAIVERVVFDHNGHIWFESQPGQGTTFYLDLPLEAE